MDSAYLSLKGLLTSAIYLVLDFGSDCSGTWEYIWDEENCYPSTATPVYLVFYALASSALLPVTFILAVEYYAADARPFFCFIWGNGAPLALALWSILQGQCDFKKFELSRATRVDDIFVRLQGLGISVLSLSIPSLIHLPKPARRLWLAKAQLKSWKQWRGHIIQDCKAVSNALSDTIPQKISHM